MTAYEYTKSLHGSTGSFTVPDDYTDLLAGTPVAFYQWDATFSRELFDDTDFDSTDNWEQLVGGMYDVKGTALCKLAAVTGFSTAATGPPLADFATQNATVDTEALADGGTFVLTTATGDSYSFHGMISVLETDVEKVGRALCRVEFQSHGAVAVTG